MTVSTAPSRRALAAPAAVLVAAIALAVALDSAIAAAAHASGASHAFTPLQAPSYASLTVIGMLAGTAGWAIVRAKTAHPRRLLGRLVPVVLVISLVPDVLVGTGSTTGVSWGAVAALMLMHVVVAALLVTALLRALPLPADQK